MRNEIGFTLIEVLLAGSLLVLALIPLMRLLPTATRHQADAEAQTQALFLAQEHLEHLRVQMAQNYTQNYSGTGMLALPYDDYAYRVQDLPDGNARTLTITVWCEANGDLVLDPEERAATITVRHMRRMP